MKSGVVWICAAWAALCAAGADFEQGLQTALEDRRSDAMAAFGLAGDGSQDYKRDSQFNKWSR